MFRAYKKGVLDFIESVHRTKVCYGFEELYKNNKDRLPHMRTVYRWLKTLKGLFEYYPDINFQKLGLVHAHLFISKPCCRWTKFPFAVESCWLVQQFGEQTLYLHCLVPEKYVENFKNLLCRFKNEGYCRNHSVFFSGDGWQFMKKLNSSLDCNGRIVQMSKEIIADNILRKEGAVIEKVKDFPLIIPVIFENYGKRMSLQGLWQAIFNRLGNNVKHYIPNGNRNLSANGKAYVKKAYEKLTRWTLFRQNCIRYRPLMKHSFEAFLIIKQQSENKLALLQRLFDSSVVMEVYKDFNDQFVVRIIGNCQTMDTLFELSFSEKNAGKLFWLNKKRTWCEERVRFKYELFFNPKSGEWQFPQEKIVQQMMEVSENRER